MYKIFCFLSAFILLFSLDSCSDSSSNVPTTIDTVSTRIIKNIIPDTLQSKFIYYSLDGDSVVPPSKSATTEWDVKMAYLYGGGKTKQIDIFLNSGTVNPSGLTKGLIVDTTFDLLTTAPADSNFKIDDQSNNGRILSIALAPPGNFFTYDGSSRTINPVAQKTLVIKTRLGNYVKLQILSIYKDQPEKPTMFSEIGYYSFRYAKSSTKKLKN